MENAHFDAHKTAALSSIDLSRKGSIDVSISDLILKLNAHADYFTSSSCSGRTMVIEEGRSPVKKGCTWLFSAHDDTLHAQQLQALLAEWQCCSHSNGGRRSVVLKFEPFICHVQCRTLAGARRLHQMALHCGARNTGITVGQQQRITLAIRTTIHLETPLINNNNSDGGRNAPPTIDHLTLLIDSIRQKFMRNAKLIGKFEECLKEL